MTDNIQRFSAVDFHIQIEYQMKHRIWNQFKCKILLLLGLVQYLDTRDSRDNRRKFAGIYITNHEL